MNYYLRVEGVNLDKVLSDTNQISVIRGSAQALREAPKELERALPTLGAPATDFTSVTTTASIGLYLFNAENESAADTVVEKTRLWLTRHYQYFTFVVDQTADTGQFQHDETKLVNLNRIRQLKQLSVVLPETTGESVGSQVACAYDGIRPVTSSTVRIERHACPSVAARFDLGRTARQSLVNSLTDKYTEQTLQFTNDLHALTESRQHGNLGGKLAVLYFDGNGFGAIKTMCCQTAKSQIDFDNTVQGYFNQYLEALIDSMRSDRHIGLTDSGDIRLEILLWGGDEIMLVVPAWAGMQALAIFYQTVAKAKFKKSGKKSEKNGIKLTFGAGIVFSQAKTPIRELSTLARNLADTVSAAYKDQNAFDYLVLESVDYPTTTLNTYRSTQYRELNLSRTMIQTVCPTQLLRVKHSIEKNYVNRSSVVDIARTAIQLQPPAQQMNLMIERFNAIVKGRAKDIAQDAADISALFITAQYDNKADKPAADNHAIWSFIHLAELWDYLLLTHGAIDS